MTSAGTSPTWPLTRATRLAYAEELPDERGATAAGFLERALTFFADQGIEAKINQTEPVRQRKLRAE